MSTETPTALFESFVAAFTQRRPGLLTLDEGNGTASIAEGSPGFGPIEIQNDGSELTVAVGRFTHGHFEMFKEDGDEASQRDATVADTIKFIEEILDDRLACYGAHQGGGGCLRVGAPRGWLSRMLGARYATTWSGKVYDRDWKEACNVRQKNTKR